MSVQQSINLLFKVFSYPRTFRGSSRPVRMKLSGGNLRLAVLLEPAFAIVVDLEVPDRNLWVEWHWQLNTAPHLDQLHVTPLGRLFHQGMPAPGLPPVAGAQLLGEPGTKLQPLMLMRDLEAWQLGMFSDFVAELTEEPVALRLRNTDTRLTCSAHSSFPEGVRAVWCLL